MAKSQIPNPKVIIARASYVGMSPRKLRLVADAVRKLSPARAIEALTILPKRAGKVLLGVYQQALGNAKNNFKMSPEILKVKSLQIGEGARFKRRDKSHGARFDSGVKRRKTAHVILELEGSV